jgi:hypothetical protein
MKATRTFAITLSALAALGLAAWLGWSALGPDGSASRERDFNFRNVALTLPPFDSELYVRQYSAPTDSAEKPGGGPVVLVIDRSDAGSGQMVIDAITREVLSDSISGALRDEADDLRDSIRAPTGDNALWPLADIEPPSDDQEMWGGITFVEPDERSGISVVVGDGVGPFLTIYNGRSTMWASLSPNFTDLELDMTTVLPDDKDAFSRLAATITFEPEEAGIR